MGWEPTFECRIGADGERHYVIGHALIDDFLEFVAARSRPNTVKSYARRRDRWEWVVALCLRGRREVRRTHAGLARRRVERQGHAACRRHHAL